MSSIQEFLNVIRMHASIANNNVWTSSVGIVTGYDQVNHLVTVQIHPADEDTPALQTGWIPFASQWIGNSWGLFVGPGIGDLCSVHYQEGDLQSAYATGFFFNDNARPLSVPSGEFWLVHKTGSSLKVTNDGKLLINGQVEVDITAPKISIIVTGDCDIQSQNANIKASNQINIDAPTVNIGNTSGSLGRLLTETAISVFNSHTHESGSIPAPDQQMSSSDLTSKTKAN